MKDRYRTQTYWGKVEGRIEAFFVKNRSRFLYLHICMAAFFSVLLFFPFFSNYFPGDVYALLEEWTTFLIWGLWFPFVFLSVLFSGRSWCGVLCPMGAASEWANKKGFKRAVPLWLRWEGTPVLSFILITTLGQTMGVRDHALAISYLFFATLIGALLIGFIYGRNKRAWCRHMCPIGLLLGVFSRLGIVQFSPTRAPKMTNQYTETGPCPTFIELKNKAESRHCITCFKCVNPKTESGILMRLRKPGREIENIGQRNPNLSEVLFLFLGTGISLGGFLWLVLPEYHFFRQSLGEWMVEKELYSLLVPGPQWLMAVYPEKNEVFLWLDFISITGFMVAIMCLVSLILVLCTSVSARTMASITEMRDWKTLFIKLAYQYAPIAMISLILGLGIELFNALTSVSPILSFSMKITFFILAFIWSAYLGWKIIRSEVSGIFSALKILLPCLCGSLFIAAAWWPSLF